MSKVFTTNGLSMKNMKMKIFVKSMSTSHLLRVLAITLLVTLFVLAGCGGGSGSNGGNGDGGGGGSNGGNGDGDNGEKPVSFAPADQQAFNNRVAGKRLQASPQHYIDF